MIFDPLYLFLFIGFAVAGFLVQLRLKSVIAEGQNVPLPSGISGKEVAERMLRDHDIHDVSVTSVDGFLTDHYDPRSKTVNLSPEVYNGRNATAAGVAAHECGHAVQHATAYSWLKMRSALVPIVSFSSNVLGFLYLAMFFIGYMAHMMNQLLLLMIILQAAITLFTLITLPVEVDASRRGLAWLNGTRITSGESHDKAVTALRWAGLTYFVAALAAIAQLLYLIMQFNNRRN